MRMGKTASLRHALASLLCAGAIASFAVTPAVAETQEQGDFWSYDNGVLTIALDGDLESYDAKQGIAAPWDAYRYDIRELVLGDGVTGIGESTFAGLTNLQTVTVGEGLTTIGAHAFEGDASMTTFVYAGSDVIADGAGAAVFSANVAAIGEDAFYGCNQLHNVYFQAEDLSGYVFDSAADANGWRYDFNNPNETTIHVLATTNPTPGAEECAALYAWNQQSADYDTPVVADIPVEGYYRVIVPKDAWNGSVTASAYAAQEPETGFVMPRPAEGYHVASVTATCEANGVVTEIPIPKQQFLGYSIDMPAGDVTVDVQFAEGAEPTSDPTDKSGSFKKADVEQAIANYPGARESFERFFRTDLGSTQEYKASNIKNRMFAKGLWKLEPIPEKYHADPTYQPSTEGMDTIYASGSTSFFEDEFRGLVRELKTVANGKKVVIVDLRDESHAFVNGIGVSWFGYLNWGNYGKTMDELVADEHERFGSLMGKSLRTYTMANDTKNAKSFRDIGLVERVKYEDELVAEEGCEYLRITGPDHSWPAPEKVDELINYVKQQGQENVWLHFNCSGGVGRTGAFLVMYDKIRNPHVDMKDIVFRQAMTGSNFFYQEPEEGSYKVPFVLEKIRQCGLFAQYVEENADNNYPVSYTQWLKDKGEY